MTKFVTVRHGENGKVCETRGMDDLQPQVIDQAKARAIEISVGTYLSSEALRQRMDLGAWLDALAVLIEAEVVKVTHPRADTAASPSSIDTAVPCPKIFAEALLERWKRDHYIRTRFPNVADYSDKCECMLAGYLPFESEIIP